MSLTGVALALLVSAVPAQATPGHCGHSSPHAGIKHAVAPHAPTKHAVRTAHARIAGHKVG